MSTARWPEAQTIRAARAALEAGDTLKLASRELRYVSSWFGLPLLPTPAGVTPRQWAARQNWTKRREKFGDSGFSEAGTHVLKLNLVSAHIAKERRPTCGRTCRRGHLWTVANARISSKGRHCRACELIVRNQRRLETQERARQEAERAQARKALIDVGIRCHRDPTSAYWRNRFVAVRDRHQQLGRPA